MLARAFPDHSFEGTEPPYPASWAPRAVIAWRWTGTMTGPLEPPGLAPTGKRIEIDGDDRWEFRGDRLCRCRVLSDVNSLSVQLGVAPAPGSAAERFTRWPSNAAAWRRSACGDAVEAGDGAQACTASSHAAVDVAQVGRAAVAGLDRVVEGVEGPVRRLHADHEAVRRVPGRDGILPGGERLAAGEPPGGGPAVMAVQTSSGAAAGRPRGSPGMRGS